jgi:hypothetical protein
LSTFKRANKPKYRKFSQERAHPWLMNSTSMKTIWTN